MYGLIQKVEAKYRKADVVDVRTGDTVKVHQKIKEGNKERIQIFEGVVIRTDRKDSLTSTIAVRRVASGVGVEKSFLLHSPLVLKVEVVKRSKVRRKFLNYLRQRSGKSARLSAIDFDKKSVNEVHDAKSEAEIESVKEEAVADHNAEDSESEAK